MAEFQGHRSWNAWAISLWIDNTREIYEYAQKIIKEYREEYGENPKKWAARAGTRIYAHYVGGPWYGLERGARWNLRCVREWAESEIEEILRFENRNK